MPLSPVEKDTREVPFSWFGQTIWKYTPYYVELIVIAVCVRLIDLVEPLIFQVIIDRVLPFQRQATLIVVAGVFAGASLFHVGFGVLSSYLSTLTANHITRELGQRLFGHLFSLPPFLL